MFNGRYGADKLGFLLIISAIVLTVVAMLLDSANIVMKFILMALSAFLLGYAIYRIFSKNIRMRERELHILEMAEYKIVSMFGKNETDDDDKENNPGKNERDDKHHDTDDEYKHFKCPKCRKHLKVPKGKGYIKVVCPACNYRFMKHT